MPPRIRRRQQKPSKLDRIDRRCFHSEKVLDRFDTSCRVAIRSRRIRSLEPTRLLWEGPGAAHPVDHLWRTFRYAAEEAGRRAEVSRSNRFPFGLNSCLSVRSDRMTSLLPCRPLLCVRKHGQCAFRNGFARPSGSAKLLRTRRTYFSTPLGSRSRSCRYGSSMSFMQNYPETDNQNSLASFQFSGRLMPRNLQFSEPLSLKL